MDSSFLIQWLSDPFFTELFTCLPVAPVFPAFPPPVPSVFSSSSSALTIKQTPTSDKLVNLTLIWEQGFGNSSKSEGELFQVQAPGHMMILKGLFQDSEIAVKVVVLKIFQEHAGAHNEPNTDLKTGLSCNSKRRL